MYKLLFIIFLTSTALVGCTAEALFGEKDPQISSVEAQALQTREYQATESQVFAAVISVFQDCGYEITSANKDTGLVQAKTVSTSEAKFGAFIKVEYQKATAFIEQIKPKEVRIRVSLVRYVSLRNSYGGGAEQEMTRTKPELYQEIFTKIDKALFLKKNM